MASVCFTGRCERSTILIISNFSDAGYLIHLSVDVSYTHIDVSPIRNHAFFEQSVFQERLGQRFFEIAGFLAQLLDLTGRGLTCRVAGQPLLASFEEVLRPLVVQALGNPLAAAQLGDRILATQALQHDADFLLG